MIANWKFFRRELSQKELETCNTLKSNGIGMIEGLCDEKTSTVFVNVSVMRLFSDLIKTINHETLHLASRKCYEAKSRTTNIGEESIVQSLEFGGYLG